jgi:hypothetical protein
MTTAARPKPLRAGRHTAGPPGRGWGKHMTMQGRITRLERHSRARARRAVWTPGAALMASVIDKARRALAGEPAEPADWSHVAPDVKAHRERLLEWVGKART